MSIRIKVGVIRCTIYGLNNLQVDSLSQALTFMDKEFVPGRSTHTSVHRVFNFNKTEQVGYFYPGYLQFVLQHLNTEFNEVAQIEDTRIAMPKLTPEPVLDFFEHDLYPHQKEAIMTLRERGMPQDYHGHKLIIPCGIVDAATNAGKDVIMMGIIKNYQNAKAIMLVDDKGIAAKASAEFKKNGFAVSHILSGDVPRSPKDIKQITVATPVVFYNQIKDHNKTWLREMFDILLVDECHQISDKFNSTLELINAPVRYGMSGTPLASASQIARGKVKQNLGNKVYTIKSIELVEAGVSRLPELHIHSVPIRQTMSPEVWAGLSGLDYIALERKVFVETPLFHQKIVEIIEQACEQAGRTIPTVVFVDKIGHGIAIERALRDAKLNVGFANGKNKAVMHLIKAFNQGKLDVLVGTSVMSTGHNMNNMEMAILASGGKSAISLLQRLGRTNRKKEGHQHIPVHDFYLGHNILNRHLRVRITAYKAQGYPVHFHYNYHPINYTER